MEVMIRDRAVQNIPLLELSSKNDIHKKSVLFILHVYLGRKESCLEIGYRFAKKHFLVILFDAHLHGELETAEFRNSDSLEKASRFLEVMQKTTDSISAISTEYENEGFADIRRTGLLGFSMGGNIVYNYLSRGENSNIKAAVCFVSTVAWKSAFDRYRKQTPGADKYLTEEIMDATERTQPLNSLANFKDVPLLMLNGEKDETASIEEARQYYSRLKAIYSRKSHVKLIEYEDIGHEITNEMLDEAETWIQRFL